MRFVAMVMFLGMSLVAACSAGDPAEQQRQSAVTESELVDHCVLFRERAYECRQELVEPLLDLRARTRPDIAKAASSPEGRAQLLKIALREFEEDGAGPLAPRQEKCSAMILQQGQPPAMHLAGLNNCDSETSCKMWVDCVVPVMKAMLTKPALK